MENIKAITILENAMETMEKHLEMACTDAPDAVVGMLCDKLTAMAEAAAKLYTATCGDKMMQPVVEMLKAMHGRPPVTGPYSVRDPSCDASCTACPCDPQG